jgi:hypothetical protein
MPTAVEPSARSARDFFDPQALGDTRVGSGIDPRGVNGLAPCSIPRYRAAMVLFPLALVWLIVVLVWVLRNSRNAAPEEPVWSRWRPTPRTPRDGDASRGARARGKRAARAR